MADAPRHCLGCAYELTGVQASPDATHQDAPTHRCPECGRPFDPKRPETTRPAPTPLWRRPRAQRAAGRIALAGVFVLSVAMTWIPRPAGGDWTRWVWLGEAYGYDVRWSNGRRTRYDVRADQLRRVVAGIDEQTPAFSLERIDDDRFRLTVGASDVVWHEIGAALSVFDIEHLQERYDAGPASRIPAPFSVEGDARRVLRTVFERYGVEPLFTLRRLGADRWRLRVRDTGVAWETLLGAFNSMRGELYGVRVHGAGSVRAAGAFEVEGPGADVLWAIVDAYELELNEPMRVPPRSDGWHPVGAFAPDPMEKEPPEHGVKMVRTIDRWGVTFRGGGGGP